MESDNGRLVRVETLLEEIRDQYLVAIKEQTIKTNGRVTVLEDRASKLETKAAANGVWVRVLWICFGAVTVFFAGIFVQHVMAK